MDVNVPSKETPDIPSAKRRAPKQNRSRNTVECIKQAAIEIISAEGFAAASTGRIAGRAGISIGSLYQYFATREGIFMALYEDVTTNMSGIMARQAVRMLELPLKEGIETTTRQMLDLYIKHKLVLIDLVHEMPELNLSIHPLSYDNLVRGSIKAFVVNKLVGIKARDVEQKVFFLERIVMDSIRAYLRAPPSQLSKRELIKEITRISVAYLSPHIGEPQIATNMPK